MAGFANPIPTKDSSKVLVRLPPAMHERLKVTAAEQGMSINTWIAILLAGGLGFTLDEDES